MQFTQEVAVLSVSLQNKVKDFYELMGLNTLSMKN
jgi:hypothetical protein